MENTIQKTLRNSEIKVAKQKRPFLTYPASGLAVCHLEETEDSVNFIFSAKGMHPGERIHQKTYQEKLRFLANCATLEPLAVEYQFSLAPENLLMDINLVPKVMLRDVKLPASPAFLQVYKALIGAVLQPRYKYEHYLNGGRGYYKKNKFVAKLAAMETTTEIQECLLEEYTADIEQIAKTKTQVSKVSVWVAYVLVPVLAVVLVAVSFFAIRMNFFDIPFRDHVIAANTAYIQSNFLAVQQELRAYDISELSIETRYFLARSYVSTEALSDAQRSNILIGLGRLTDPNIFDFWILLGRLHFAEAAEIARRVGDDELLLFTYHKQEAFVRQDLSIPGDERMALLDYLTGQIDRITRARADAVQQTTEQ